MGTHVSVEQVESWLDENVVRNVDRITEPETEFNIQFDLSRLPLHVIKEETWGPLRLVGKNAFDTDRTRAIIEDDDQRRELLAHIGPGLTATPGFYTFLDADGIVCEFANVHQIQFEHRIYPDGASQHALMSGLINLAMSMRHVQNAVAEMRGDDHNVGDRTGGVTDIVEEAELDANS
jgi:hypothetical protein